MQRFFRPGHVLASGRGAWLLDDRWPVAALAVDDSISAVVGWSWPDRCPDVDDDRQVVADGIGIVVRDGGQLTWVREHDRVAVAVEPELHLAAADEQVAWLVDRSDVDPGHPPEAPPPLPRGRVVAVARDGERVETVAPAPVTALTVDGTDIWLTLAEAPRATPHRRGDGWSFSYPTRVLRVDRPDLLAGRLTVTGDTGDGKPATRRGAWTWLETDPDLIRRHGVPAGGLMWWTGTPPDGDRIERLVVLVGHDATTGESMIRLELGVGIVGDLAAVGDEVWICIARRRFLAEPRDRGVDVLAVSPSGSVRTVHECNAIDVSDHAPPLLPLPAEQIQQHIDETCAQFDDLESYWRSPDGSTSPLADGLSDAAATLRGTWPDVELVIEFRHAERPGLTLRRTLALFDERGCPTDHQYAAIHLMEDLDTNYIAPAADATDGILDT
ncbi:MAG: hypothetical protein INR67_01880 [Jatrophihabitans endophyticus]|nr:hypothetical protein [Jatrophihabitans endophyticus]